MTPDHIEILELDFNEAIDDLEDEFRHCDAIEVIHYLANMVCHDVIPAANRLGLDGYQITKVSVQPDFSKVSVVLVCDKKEEPR
jgi:hypothetical protein